jgi:L,D-transpeptidase YcbB
MKKYFIPILISCTFFIACNNSPEKENNTTETGTAADIKKITKRDYTITASNAYNNVFFDSTAMEAFMKEKKMEANEARRLRSFYNARNYQFAWFTPTGVTEQTRLFWNQYEQAVDEGKDSTLIDKTFAKKINSILNEDDSTPDVNSNSVKQAEWLLTRYFIRYINTAYQKGFVKRKELEKFIPIKKQDALQLADSILNKKHSDDKYYDQVNESYARLKKQLKKFVAFAKTNNWQLIETPAKPLTKGASSPIIMQVKKRMNILSGYDAADTTATYTQPLEDAVKTYQATHGLTSDGKINKALAGSLNTPVKTIIAQILLNMDRMRWMPQEAKGSMIVVNIPEYVLHVIEGKQKVFDMDVVVGKQGHNTVMFSGNLNEVVFAPYWNVPESIVKKEILPSIQKKPGYLQQQNMEVVQDGPTPEIRQLPGEKNSLGKVKFLFPNSHDIYFHDTPVKSLFNKSQRAYSHGCIRLSDPMKMAKYLLQNDAEWTDETIAAAMNSDTEKRVRVKKTVPVLIMYYTAWVDDNGVLNIRDDIYGHDKELMRKMFM